MNKLHIYSSFDINYIIDSIKTNPQAFINSSEAQFHDKLTKIIKTISDPSSTYKILLLSGPSASGKTSCAQLLKKALKKIGIRAWLISLDDFFWDPEKIPILKNGEPDYESINSLDLQLVHKCLNELITTSKSDFPIFNFLTNRRSNIKKTVKIKNGDILILEGLHALNPKLLLPSYSKKCLKVYISVSTSYHLNNSIIIPPKDIRLIRRTIRDYKFRNTSPYETLKMWPTVCLGEKEFIEPFKESAQLFIDSCINYEPCIFYKYLDSIIKKFSMKNIFYADFIKTTQKFSYFPQLHSSMIPNDSILREFIGFS